MPPSNLYLEWTSVRGRNGFDPATDLFDDMATECQNVYVTRGQLGIKRNGSSTINCGIGSDCATSMTRFVPGQSDALAEIIFTNTTNTALIYRIAAGTSATSLSRADNITNDYQSYTTYAQLNGKCYIAYNSAVNRLHVFSPTESTSVVRRVGLAPQLTANFAVSNHGSGSYAAVQRYYQIVLRVFSGSTLLRQSEPMATSLSFTPDGSSASARITKSANTTEGETHWVVFGSTDNVLFYELGSATVATTTFDDSVSPSTYNTFTPMPPSGTFDLWPSVKYLASDGNRLLGFGAWETTDDANPTAETTPKDGRVWFSPVLDTTGTDDDERVSNTTTFEGWIDIARNSGAEDRALVGPMDDQFFAFQSRGIYMLSGTGDAIVPFRRITISKVLGAVSHQSCFIGEDEQGRACVYFLDPERGPYRYGAHGLQWCGYDIQDIWATFQPAGNPIAAHGVWHAARRMAMWWIATGNSAVPNKVITFAVREGESSSNNGVRYGWAQWTGAMIASTCSAMLPSTFGSPMTRTLLPYASNASISGIPVIIKCDDPSVVTDSGTNQQAFVTSRAYRPKPAFLAKESNSMYLQAAAAASTTIQQSVIQNFGSETRSVTVSIAPTASETRVFKQFEDAAFAQAWAVQIKLGDAVATDKAWALDAWFCNMERREDL